MTEEHETNETNASIYRFGRLPWLIALGALLLYAITLNHWVTMGSVMTVAKVTGWDWHPTWLDWRPTTFAPLYTLLTSPIRLFPAGMQAVALNAFSAVCAALTLGLLARSVALLPHDRSRDQRLRDLDSSGVLTGFRTVVPQILAVLVCGLQQTFWEDATTANTEILDLLGFSALIWCLLEYRLSKEESWLTRFALIYGVAMTNNWALIGFAPFFLVAVIWMKGLEFFRWGFVGKLAAWFAPGLLLYLVLPIAGSVADGGGFWHILRLELSSQKTNLLFVPRWMPIIFSLPTLIALGFIGVRWPSFQGDLSAMGAAIGNFGFRLLHLLLFIPSLWFFLDIKYSPRSLTEVIHFLTFYYMAAISVGYFAGYFLFVLTTEPMAVWARRAPLARFAAYVSLAILGAASVVAPVWLAYKNAPRIQTVNRNYLKDYAVSLAQALPAKGAVILSDDHARLMLVKAAFQELGKSTADNVFVETDSMAYGQYLGYLAKLSQPAQNAIGTVSNLPPVIDSLSSLRLLSLFKTKSNLSIYYLHPSFGFFFEHFYTRPRGLVFELSMYSTNQFEPPALTEPEIRDNLAIWKKLQSDYLAAIPKAAKRAADAEAIGWYCSRSANVWGVELQKANHLKEAADFFTLAVQLNPQNHLAKINQAFNRNLQEKNTQSIDSSELITDAKRQYRSMEGVLNAEGTADEPEMQYRIGQSFAAGGNLRQAYLLFQRRLALRPGDFEAQLAIAKTYTDMGMPDKAIACVREAEPKASTPADKAELYRIEALSMVIKGNWDDAEALLLSALKQSPQDERRIGLLVEYYRVAGVTLLREQKTDKANQQFKKALNAVDSLLAVVKSGNRTDSTDESDVLLKKAELQTQLADYPGAISTLTVLLQRKPDSPTFLFNRALAFLKSKKYPEAKQDYIKLAKAVPSKVPAVYYGLGEVAFQTNDRKEAIKNFRAFLELVPADAEEHKQIAERLASLEAAK